MLIRYIFAFLALFVLTGCEPNKGESAFNQRPQIVSETNTFDRIVILRNNALWERRWNPATNAWAWIEHAAMTAQLAIYPQSDLALGPMLCNMGEDICRIYVHVDQLSDQKDSKAKWLLYTFDPNVSDYSNFGSFNIAPYTPVSIQDTKCRSNFSYDSDWNMYCIRTFEFNSNGRSNLLKYDLDLNFITDSPGSIITNKNNLKDVDVHMRPCVMSSFDIFYAMGKVAIHGNSLLELSTHSKDVRSPIDVAQADSNQCQMWVNSKRVYGRRFSQNTNSWQWDNNGRPIKKSKIKYYGEGTMRTSDNRLYLLAKPKYSNTRVFERYNQGSGWFWADHGFPNQEVLTEIGWVANEQFFLLSKSGKLYQRQWRDDQGKWVWYNHGTP